MNMYKVLEKIDSTIVAAKLTGYTITDSADNIFIDSKYKKILIETKDNDSYILLVREPTKYPGYIINDYSTIEELEKALLGML